MRWQPGQRDLWDPPVTAVSGNTLTLDAPLTTALPTLPLGKATVTAACTVAAGAPVGCVRGESALRIEVTGMEGPERRKHQLPRRGITIEHADEDGEGYAAIVFEHLAGSAVARIRKRPKNYGEDCKSAHARKVSGIKRWPGVESSFYHGTANALYRPVLD